MDEQETLTKEELENAKGAKINLSITAAIFTFVIGFSLLSEFLTSGYVLGICLLVIAFLVKAIFSLDNYRFKSVKNCSHKSNSYIHNHVSAISKDIDEKIYGNPYGNPASPYSGMKLDD